MEHKNMNGHGKDYAPYGNGIRHPHPPPLEEDKPSTEHIANRPHSSSRSSNVEAQAAQVMVENGVTKFHQRIDVLFLKSIWGGILISYGGMLESCIGGSPSANTNNPGLLRFAEGLVFPIGLSMIVLTGSQLLTSDMMFFFIAALKGRVPWWSIVYAHAVVFLGNLAGSLFVAMVLGRYTGLITPPMSSFIQAATIGRTITPMWHEVFFRGIGCNILVCIGVFLAAQASDLISKVIGIWIAVFPFVVIQYEHVVADMFIIPLGIALDAPGTSVGLYIWKPMTAAFLGNMVGAWLLSLSLHWMYLHDSSAKFFGGRRANVDVEQADSQQGKRS